MRLSYTKQADAAIRTAGRTAREMKHPYIGSEHLLLGLRREYSGVAGQILAKNGIEEERILHLTRCGRFRQQMGAKRRKSGE